MTILETAKSYHRADLCAIPVKADGSKRPAVPWDEYKIRKSTEAEIDRWFGPERGIGLVCGKVSGNLEVIDFDEPALYEPWCELVTNLAPGLLDRLTVHRTPRDGRHVIYRCDTIGRNTKLATDPARKPEDTLIETRAEGGQILAPGCAPECHETRRLYAHESGPLVTDVTTITAAERDILLSAARTFDLAGKHFRPFNAPELSTTASDHWELRPGEDYNAKTSWEEILTGWRKLYTTKGVTYWQRPGKAGPGCSATTGHCGENLYVFTSNASPFINEKSYDKFAAYTLLNHNGDFKAAAVALFDKGFGKKTEKKKTVAKTEAPRIPYQAFPIELLPAAMGRFIEETAESMGCDNAYVALPALSVAAAAIGTTRVIRLRDTWSEPAVVWTMVVAPSGSLKSPSFDAAVVDYRNGQIAALRDHEAAMTEHEKAMQIYERDYIDWKKANKKGVDPPEKPIAPTAPRSVVSETTVEALAPILRDNPRGLLLARDEGSGWLNGFNQYKGGKGNDPAAWLELWRAGTLIQDRKSGDHKTIVVPRAAVSVCGTIQPDILTKAMTPEYVESGLAARLLLAYPPSRPKEWSVRPMPKDVVNGYVSMLLGLIRLEHSQSDFGPEPKTVALSAGALPIWIEFYNRHARRTHEAASSREAAALAKIEAYAARFALIIALCEEPWIFEISADVMRRGIALAEWFASECERVNALCSETPEQAADRNLVDLIRAKGGDVVARDLTRNARKFPTAESAEIALNRLVTAGLAVREAVDPGPKGGRPTSRYILVSADTTPENTNKSGVLVSSALSVGAKQEAEAVVAEVA